MVPMGRMNTDARPWFREPWPWLLMAGPAMVIMAGFATLYLAITTEDGLVVDDYYRQGLAINATLAREERATALGLSAALEFSAQHDRVQLMLAGVSGRPAHLRLRLVHPTKVGQDQSAILIPVPGRGYAALIRPLGQGAWHVVLEDEAAGWRLAGTLPPRQDRLELRPRQQK
jgi:hypothetical protein